jgi:hypothetical protein
MVEQLDPEVRLRFFEKRLIKLQEAVLQLDVDINSSEENLKNLKLLKDRASQEIEKVRPQIIMAKGEIEEKNRGVERR